LSLLRHRRLPVRPAHPDVRPRRTSILPIVAPAAQGVARGTEGINTYSHFKPGFCLTSTFVLLFFAIRPGRGRGNLMGQLAPRHQTLKRHGENFVGPLKQQT
jgi:hypothetical protein